MRHRSRHIALRRWAVAVALAGLVGCARTAEERQLESMRNDIERLQDDRDRADRSALPPTPPVGSLASGPATPPVDGAPRPAPRPLWAVPAVISATEPIRVVTPQDELPTDAEYADPDDTAPRPKIRVSGGVRSRTGPREEEVVDPAAVDNPVPPGASGSLDPAAKRAYDGALALVSAHEYDAALDALAAFLVKWPDHPYVDHAMYWRGECLFARGDFARASEQFEGVVARFPAGAKAPDALLKLGMSQQRLGHVAEAKESFIRLARDYPQADASRRIPSVTVPAAAPSRPALEDHR